MSAEVCDNSNACTPNSTVGVLHAVPVVKRRGKKKRKRDSGSIPNYKMPGPLEFNGEKTRKSKRKLAFDGSFVYMNFSHYFV